MTRRTNIEHRFVDSAPDVLDDGVLYVSIRYATALHLCPCGCSSEIVTPISREGWSLTFDGVSVTLHPSVGNWNYPCRSHYWIRRNRIEWAKDRSHDGPDRHRSASAVGSTAPGRQHQDPGGAVVGKGPRLMGTVRAWLRRHGRADDAS
ncbi:DUF6527 family protein [Micromonospora mangrovi]|uniref:DUF6527 family protein n=2 Tax=Micromonospora TaxID=1873 RepID=A0AAU7MB23_9ACTN